jgi:hypothetical protein
MSTRRSTDRPAPEGWAASVVVAILLTIMAWIVLASVPIVPLRVPGLPTRADVFGITETAQRELLRTNGKAGPNTQLLAGQLLRLDPVSGTAMTLLGLAAERETQAAKARAFMQEALRRDPRGAGTRAWFVYNALQNDRVDDALKGTERLMALVPDALPIAMQIFVYFSERPEAQPRLMAMLKRQSGWHDPFLGQLAASNVSPETLARLGNAVAKGGGDQGRTAILEALVQRGETSKARQLWLDTLPESAKKSSAFVYDPEFAKLPGLAPFNWSFKTGDEGSAEIDGARGVAVDYFGRGSPVLAEQVILLNPGSYTLNVSVSTATLNTESLAWGVYCARTAKPLNQVRLAPVQGGEPVLFRANFIVPEWCETQSVKLVGSPPSFPAVVNATIRSVQITRAGQSSRVESTPTVPKKPAS